jgi:hypothetical protein
MHIRPDLPLPIREACEPCRALPRAPGKYPPPPLDAPSRWTALRARRAINAAKWPKLVAKTKRAEHVPLLLERLAQEEPPANLLAPPVEATWLWLETEKAAKLSDAPAFIIDLWASLDVAAAVENLVAFAALADRGGARMSEPRRLRAHLSVVDEEAWSRARATMEVLVAKASSETAALLAFLFPEDEARALAAARKVREPHGYEHLLALAVADAEILTALVEAGENAWGMVDLQGAIPAWAVVALGPAARPVVQAVGKLWPDNVIAELAYLDLAR